LENIKAANVAPFAFLAVLIYYFGEKFFNQVQYQKKRMHIRGSVSLAQITMEAPSEIEY
jgi:hypothetical protein